MIKNSYLILLFISGFFSTSSLAQTPMTGFLKLTVTGFENDQGTVKIALVNSETQYYAKANGEAPFRTLSSKINNKRVEYTLENIPFGEYAIKLFHDENGNNNLDLNFLGVPSEAYGFSNNVRGKFGPPTYQSAQFLFNVPEMAINIQVK